MTSAAAPDTLNRPSIDPEEVEKFSRIAAEWWDPDSKFKPLHKFNPVRLGFIRDTICAHFGLSGERPFEGLRILDIGCGGGLDHRGRRRPPRRRRCFRRRQRQRPGRCRWSITCRA